MTGTRCVVLCLLGVKPTHGSEVAAPLGPHTHGANEHRTSARGRLPRPDCIAPCATAMCTAFWSCHGRWSWSARVIAMRRGPTAGAKTTKRATRLTTTPVASRLGERTLNSHRGAGARFKLEHRRTTSRCMAHCGTSERTQGSMGHGEASAQPMSRCPATTPIPPNSRRRVSQRANVAHRRRLDVGVCTTTAATRMRFAATRTGATRCIRTAPRASRISGVTSGLTGTRARAESMQTGWSEQLRRNT